MATKTRAARIIATTMWVVSISREARVVVASVDALANMVIVASAEVVRISAVAVVGRRRGGGNQKRASILGPRMGVGPPHPARLAGDGSVGRPACLPSLKTDLNQFSIVVTKLSARRQSGPYASAMSRPTYLHARLAKTRSPALSRRCRSFSAPDRLYDLQRLGPAAFAIQIDLRRKTPAGVRDDAPHAHYPVANVCSRSSVQPFS